MLCARLLFIMAAQPVAKAHQAVAQMDVFHCDLRINDRKIIVAEVPEALNTQPNQLVRKVHGALARHAQHGDHRLVRRTEAFQLGQRADGYAADLLALQGGVDIKRGNQLVAVGIAADKAGDQPRSFAICTIVPPVTGVPAPSNVDHFLKHSPA